MAVRIDKKSWWVDFRYNHTRYRKRSPENSKAGARAYEAVLRSKLARGENINREAQAKLQEQAFAQFARRWFDDYVVPNNKYSEQKAKRHILSSRLVPFFGKLTLGEIASYHVEQYKARQLKTGVSNKTINNQLAVLNKCLVTAYDWLLIETSPPKIKKLRCAPARMDHLSQEEAELLLTHSDGIMYEMLLMTLRTGMRQGELKGLQWEAVDWQSGAVRIIHSWNDDLRELEAPKSNRERLIPLDAEVADRLWKRKKVTGFVYLDADGMPFTEERLNPRLATLCKKVGLRKITWHILRHTFATHVMMQGAAANTVQMLLGHASITTTMRYAHVPSSSLREAIQLLSQKRDTREALGQPVVSRDVSSSAEELAH
jgi:integrase